MTRLLEVLRGNDDCCAMDDEEWESMLALADEERVAAWTAASLQRRCQSLTVERQNRLKEIVRDSSIAGFFWSCELKNLLGAFARQAIDVVPLKGPFLAERLYGGAGLRGSRDLDLLVKDQDLKRAESVLAACDFAPQPADDYHRAWHRRGVVVELHYDVENPLAFDFVVASALRRSEAAKFQEETCRQFAPEDELLYLCLHAARHRYERLSLILDLRLALEGLRLPAPGWELRPEVRDMKGLLALGLEMVERFDPGYTTSIAVDVSPAYRAQLAAVADGLWYDLMVTHRTAPLDWRAAHDFFMEIEQPGLARIRRWIRHLRILSSRVIEADSIYASRFGLHRAWHARLLRPVRLVTEKFGGRSGVE